MFALLLACTGNLVSRAVEFGKFLDQYPSKTVQKIVATLSVALVKIVTFNHFPECLNAWREVNCTHTMSENQLGNRKHVCVMFLSSLRMARVEVCEDGKC